MNLLTVIPARGGSRGIPRKNIVDLCGKPLLAYTIECALHSGVVDDVWVSTDSEAIASVANAYGGKVIERPSALGSDTASTESALIHAIDYASAQTGRTYDTVLTLQPTSPLRRSDSIARFVKAYESRVDEIDALLTLHRDSSDFWVQKDQAFSRLYPDAPRRRQERDPLFVENSCMYITAVQALKNNQFILGTRCDGFEIDPIEAIDINEPIDLLVAEAALKYQMGVSPKVID